MKERCFNRYFDEDWGGIMEFDINKSLYDRQVNLQELRYWGEVVSKTYFFV